MSRRASKPWDQKIASDNQEESPRDYNFVGLDVEGVSNFNSALNYIEKEARGLASMDITMAEIDIIKLLILREPLENRVFRLEDISLADRIILKATSFYVANGDLYMQFTYDDGFMRKVTSMFLGDVGFSYVRSMKIGRLRNRAEKLTTLISHLCRARPLVISIELRNLSYMEYNTDGEISCLAPLQLFASYIAFQDAGVGEKFRGWLQTLQTSFDTFNHSLVYAAEATHREAQEIESKRGYDSKSFDKSLLEGDEFQPRPCSPGSLAEIKERNKAQLQQDLANNNLVPANFDRKPVLQTHVVQPQPQLASGAPPAVAAAHPEIDQSLYVTAMADNSQSPAADTPKPQRDKVVRRNLMDGFVPNAQNDAIVNQLNQVGANTQDLVPENLQPTPALQNKSVSQQNAAPEVSTVAAPPTQAPPTSSSLPLAPAGLQQPALDNTVLSPAPQNQSLFDMTSQLSVIGPPRPGLYPALPPQQQPAQQTVSMDQLALWFQSLLQLTPQPQAGFARPANSTVLPAASVPTSTVAPLATTSAAVPSASLAVTSGPASGLSPPATSNGAPLAPPTSVQVPPSSENTIKYSDVNQVAQLVAKPSSGVSTTTGGQTPGAGSGIQTQAGAFSTQTASSRPQTPSKLQQMMNNIKTVNRNSPIPRQQAPIADIN